MFLLPRIQLISHFGGILGSTHCLNDEDVDEYVLRNNLKAAKVLHL